MLSSFLTFAAQNPIVAESKPYQGMLICALLLGLVTIAFDYFTRAGTIARATTKEAVRQPVFLLLAVVGAFTILANTFVPFFAFGEDTKVFVDSGLATVLICSLLLAVWTASMSVADEIEGKTAMTLLSKPINRRQFVVGKYVGIAQAVFFLITIIGSVFFVLTYYKYGYDQKEAGKGDVSLFIWSAAEAEQDAKGEEITPERKAELQKDSYTIPRLVSSRVEASLQILPGLVLIFLEAAVMTSVSVAISTRVPMMVNIISCFSIFVIGHLTPVLVASSKFENKVFVKFVAQLVATVLPGLEHFNNSAAIATGTNIPPHYLGYCAVYAATYISATILLAFILFEDRDLA